jgi:glutaredoxin
VARITFYTRKDCPLCDEAAHLLQRLALEFGLEVEEVDIETDAALLERYKESIPAIALDGEPLLSAPLDEPRVRMVLTRRLHKRPC